MDMINILKTVGVFSAGTCLVTMDIQNLFTNVDHQDGLNAMCHFLEKRPPETTPSTLCLRELAEIVLSKNVFFFEKVTNLYRQCKGSAMDSKMSPDFNSLYVACFENDYIFSSENPFKSHIKLWKRYVDDIFMIYDGSVESLLQFYEYLNCCQDHLKFTIEHDTQQISFLDILVKPDGTVLVTDLYRKETDKCSFLHGQSFHPTHLKKSLPISQFSRIRRICTKQTEKKSG